MDSELLAAAKQLGVRVGFDKSRTNGWFISVNRKKNYFPSQKAQENALKGKIAEIRLMGVDALEVTTADRHSILEMRKLAEVTKLTPLEIFQRGLNSLCISTEAIPLVSDCVAQFVQVYEKLRKDGEISAERMYEVRRVALQFSASCRGLKMDGVTRQHLDRYINGLDVGEQTKRNHARIIRRLFNWARDKGLVNHNPVPLQKRIKRDPVIWTPDQVRAYFKKLFEITPTLAPMMALRWFGGIRPKATTLMHWEVINFDEKRVGIPREMNKLREADTIEGLPDQLWLWLKKYRKKEGLIADPNYRKLTAKLHKELGFSKSNPGKRWPEDVARHSFASHALPIYGVQRVSEMLLHRDKATTIKHYLVFNVSKARAKEYLAIAPKHFRQATTKSDTVSLARNTGATNYDRSPA